MCPNIDSIVHKKTEISIDFTDLSVFLYELNNINY